jgi:hypothetical protein
LSTTVSSSFSVLISGTSADFSFWPSWVPRIMLFSLELRLAESVSLEHLRALP